MGAFAVEPPSGPDDTTFGLAREGREHVCSTIDRGRVYPFWQRQKVLTK
jgi:hypothetical protein